MEPTHSQLCTGFHNAEEGQKDKFRGYEAIWKSPNLIPTQLIMLNIYNSLTRQKDLFQPRQPGQVKLYVCGMTVYDYCHIGHARTMLAFDMIVRWLDESGYDVTFVRNHTDVDDKIIARANEKGIEPLALSAVSYTHLTLPTKA